MSAARDIGRAKALAKLERKEELSRRLLVWLSRDKSDVCDVMPELRLGDD
jgi:hypothetical protein